MRAVSRRAWRLVGFAAVALLAALAWVALPAAAVAGGGTGASSSASAAATGGGSAVSLGSLVVPGVQALDGGQQELDAGNAARATPAAFAARRVSRTEYEHLDPTQATALAGRLFPALVNRREGGPPRLPAGTRLVGYSASNAAAIALPGGRHGVIESVEPIATPSGRGHFKPLDLGLRAGGGGYEPANGYVAVRIPKRLSGGVSMPGIGVSLTPVDAHGRAPRGPEGAQDGASVVYADTQTDTDTLAKPTAGGFALDSLLRSVDSPGTLNFKVGMPAGARLVGEGGPGGARVVSGKRTLAAVAPPSATDAAGTSVPVRMSVSGDTLVVTVEQGAGEYDYPIEVDPHAYDSLVSLSSTSKANWEFYASPKEQFEAYESAGVVMRAKGAITEGEHDELVYPAHGQASVTYIEGESEVSASEASDATTKLEFVYKKSAEEKSTIEEEYTLAKAGESYARSKKAFGDKTIEGVEGFGALYQGNELRIMQTANHPAAEGYGFWFQLFNASVGVLQEKGPEVRFNTTPPTISQASNRQNVLYGAGSWLGESNGAVEVVADDSGIGVSDVKITDLTAGPHGEHWTFNDPVYEHNLCTGIWCTQAYTTYFTYSKEMAEGTNTFEVCAEDRAFMKTCTSTTVNVDDTAPYGLKIVSGLAEEGAEISATQHQLTLEAKDGTSPTSSSGIKAIALSVDGREVGGPAGACSPGPCTGNGAWTIDGENLGAGEHKLEMIATDNAGNISATKVITFAIRNATPAKIPPGTVDPVTGQLTLRASDVGIAGAGSVSRAYLSRSLKAGAEGPLGPQWGLSIGAEQSLRVLPNGNAELKSATGGLATFESNGKGGFVAPKGDESLSLEAKEREAGKGVTEYLLKTPSAGVTTTFAQPPNIQRMTPSYQTALKGAGGGRVIEPNGIAIDAKGDLWVVDKSANKVDEFNKNGEFVSSIGKAGSGSGEFKFPSGITIDKHGNLWVTDAGNKRVEEFNEKGEYQSQFGLEKFTTPAGIAIGGNGDIWVVDNGSNRVKQFNEKEEYVGAFGVSGRESGQLDYPTGIVFDAKGDLWITDTGAGTVEEFNEKGEYLSKFAMAEKKSGSADQPAGIAIDAKGDFWVADGADHRVEVFNEKGEYQSQFGGAGENNAELEAPYGIALAPNGEAWVTDPASGRVSMWDHPAWLPVTIETPAAGDKRSFAYRAVEEGEKLTVEPTEVLGPVPAGVSCGKNPEEVKLEELKAGCRALSFTYAEKTTASGEGPSEWGEYTGRLAKVSFTGYNTTSKAMETTAVAQYAYDKQGRLRAEWDPRISPALKTAYGYDPEGHVTAVSPPAQQPYLLTYGTSGSDTGTGRLLSVTRPAATTTLGSGLAPANTTAPALSTTHPAEGDTLSVSEGSWSNTPLTHGYQWKRCQAGTCTSILGATNQTYTPSAADCNYELVAVVTATNAGGSAAVESNVSHAVQGAGYWSRESEFGGTGEGNGQFKDPWGIAVSKGEGSVYVADSGNGRIEKFNSAGTFQKSFGKKGSGSEQFSGPEGLAQDGKYVYVADTGNLRLASVQTSFTSGDENSAAGATPSWISEGEAYGSPSEGTGLHSYLFVSSHSENMVAMYLLESEGIINGKRKTFGGEGTGNGQFKGVGGVTEAGLDSVYVVDEGNDRVEEFNSHQEYVGQFGEKGSGNGQFVSPKGIAVFEGNLYVVDSGNNRVEEFNQKGEYLAQFSVAAGAQGIALGRNGAGEAFMYVTNGTTNKVERWQKTTAPNPAPAPPNPGTSAVSTVEYHVPLSGGSAPQQMISKELAKWGQTNDEPVEATAIFPPDEPQGWPASDYKRATVFYMDAHARTTNTASPSGAISTVEYNSLNEVTRTLSASDRAIAMKETCEEGKCKSAEVAKALSSEKIYNSEGTQLLETYGPEHKIKLANGTEEETRDRQKFSYNEGAPKSGENYDLATKVTTWIENPAKEHREEHEAKKWYGGGAQGELGWTLRKPTEEAAELNGQTSTSSTRYSPETGQALETSVGITSAAPAYMTAFGSKGTGSGQFNTVLGDAIDAQGDVWVIDSGNSRLQELSAGGSFLKAVGAKGSGGLQFSSPWGVAINKSTGNIYVTDVANNRVQELSSSGAFVRTWGFGVSNGKAEFEVCTSSCKAGTAGSGAGQFNAPLGVAVDASGNVWVVDSGNSRVEEFSSEGAFLKTVGAKGSGHGQFTEPNGIAFSGARMYVVDYGDNRVEMLSSTGTYLGEFGSKGSSNGQFNHPYGIGSDPSSGDLYVADVENHRVEEFTPAGIFITKFGSSGTGAGQFSSPLGVAVNNAGDIYVADLGNERVEEWEPIPSAPVYTAQFGGKGTENGQFTSPKGIATAKNGNLLVLDASNNRVEEFSPAGKYEVKFATGGSGVGQVKAPYGIAVDPKGNVWIADTSNNRVDEFNEKHEFVQAFGWGVNKGEAKLEVCTTVCKIGTVGTGSGELDEPKGIAVTSSGNVYVSDTLNNRIQEFTEKGEFVATFGFGVTDGKAEFEICTTTCKAGAAGAGNGQLSSPIGLAVDSLGNVWVADKSNNRVEEFSEKDEYESKFGEKGSGNGQLNEPKGVTIDAAGNLWIADSTNDRVQELTPAGTYLAAFGDKGAGNGQLEEPWGVAFAGGGAVYVSDSKNNRVEQWTSAPRPGSEGAHGSRATYYSAEANSEFSECGKHPEWANLVCRTEPAVQPGDSGPPPLPIVVTTYNTWDEPKTVTETIGAITRTITKLYDGAGRETSDEETSTSTEDGALPAVADEYNTETGALVKESQTLEGKVKTLKSVYNSLAQLTSYTDAEGATTKYAYDVDGRVEEVSEPKGSQIYSYDATTGFMTKLLDSAAGTFTAGYGVSGEMLTEGYPNGMTAKYTYNTIGQTTNLEYEKTTHCSEKCVWFSDSEAFGVKGELVSQTSSLSSENYSYNGAGELSQTQETPVGKGCVTRQYGYSESTGERLSLATHEPNEKGECTSEGGVVEGHSYDVVGRLLDPGVTYDALGNMTKVPALDAGGQAITSSFYVDNQVASQEQNEKTISYIYDPAGRTLIASAKTKSGTTKTISHYAGPAAELAWTCEEEAGKTECEEGKGTKWTRNIPGIDGALDAIQTNGGAPVLQLHDLQGNIVGTAGDEAEGKFLPMQNSTEFGVPPTGKTTKYAWLGATGTESELETGVITQSGATYVPQIARSIQTEPVLPPGAAPNGMVDTEAYRPPPLPWTAQSGDEGAANTLAEQRMLEKEEKCAQEPDECDPVMAVIGGESGGPTGTYEEFLNETATWYALEILPCGCDAEAVLNRFADTFAPLIPTEVSYHNTQLEEYFGHSVLEQWDDILGRGLEMCLNGMLEHQAGGEKSPNCRINTRHIALEGTNKETGALEWVEAVTDFFIAPEISLCLDGDGECTLLEA